MADVVVQFGDATAYDPLTEAAKRRARRRTLRANIERSINWMWRITDPEDKKGRYREATPGLTRVFPSIPGPVRGMYSTGGSLFVVASSTLYEITESLTVLNRGTLKTAAGPVGMVHGTTQLVIVDGPNGYVFDLNDSTFGRITSPAFYGSRTVAFLDGFFLFIRPDTQQFYRSEINNARDLDALNFASAESDPDRLSAVVVNHREMFAIGERTTEPWFNQGNDTLSLARNSSAIIEVGTTSPYSALKLDSSVFLVGQDKNGAGMVYRFTGYQAQRISRERVEEDLALCDLTTVTAYAYQQDGQSFYCLNCPDLETTWVYEVGTNEWHERAELVNGVLEPLRVTCHAYFAGENYAGGPDGMYVIDPWNYTIDGTAMYREYISTHGGDLGRRMFFDAYELDITVGETAQGIDPRIEMRYSNDGGFTWSAWRARSLGRIGEFNKRVRWTALGSALGANRVWHVRTSNEAKPAIQSVKVTAR